MSESPEITADYSMMFRARVQNVYTNNGPYILRPSEGCGVSEDASTRRSGKITYRLKRHFYALLKRIICQRKEIRVQKWWLQPKVVCQFVVPALHSWQNV